MENMAGFRSIKKPDTLNSHNNIGHDHRHRYQLSDKNAKDLGQDSLLIMTIPISVRTMPSPAQQQCREARLTEFGSQKDAGQTSNKRIQL